MTPSKLGGRPVRATRGKRTSLAAGFIDSSTLKIESDDDIDDDELFKRSKKPRLASSSASDDEDDFATAHTRNSAAPSSRNSSSPSPSPEPEPEPKPWELKFYPETYYAVETFQKLLGAPPPDTDDLDAAASALADAMVPMSLKSNTVKPMKAIVKLKLPKGTIDKNASFDPKKVGFMDFPGELRNQIYYLVFKHQNKIIFKSRTGFSHSSAFLRVNKTIYNEARKFLYGENRFIFDQSTSRIGNYFEEHWREPNYYFLRKFFSDIGPVNTGLIKDIGLNLEDATPSGHPGTTMNDRRFEKNKDLYWILKYLARHGKIEKLKLGIAGRRTLRLHRSNAAFLHALAAVKTDDLIFGHPYADIDYSDRWDRSRYGRIETELIDLLEGVMVRPQPLKLLDPRLVF